MLRQAAEKLYVIFPAHKNDRLCGVFRKHRQVLVIVAFPPALVGVGLLGKRDIIAGRKETGGYKTPACRQDKDILVAEDVNEFLVSVPMRRTGFVKFRSPKQSKGIARNAVFVFLLYLTSTSLHESPESAGSSGCL